MADPIDHIETLPIAASDAARLGLARGDLRLRAVWPRDDVLALAEFEDAEGRAVSAQWYWADVVDGHGRARDAFLSLAEQIGSADGLAHLGAGVVLHARGADARLPVLASLLAVGCELVVHRPGRRAVVRARVDGDVVFTKVTRARTARRLVAVAGQLRRRAPVVELTGAQVSSGVTIWRRAPGERLLDLLAGPQACDAAAAAGRAVRALHGACASGLPTREPDREWSDVERWARFVGRVAPSLMTLVEPGPSAGPQTPPASRHHHTAAIHGDLHEKQVMIEGGRATLIDIDGAAAGDPAVDVGNLLAHLQLRARQGLISDDTATRAAAAFLAAYGPTTELLERAAAYSRTTLLRLACVYAVRPRWRGIVADLADMGRGSRAALGRDPLQPLSRRP